MGATMGKNGGNLLDSLPSAQGTMHIVMLGLDSAGKTTALYRLKFDQYLNTVPTIGFNCEKVRGSVGKAKGVQFLVWDVGGQEKLRPLWRSYTRCTDGIVFVVDSVDVERMEEAKMELMRTAKCPDNQGVPVLILANKQDLPGAREPKELEKLLGLHELSPIYPTPGFTQSLSLSSSSSVGDRQTNLSSNCGQQQNQQQQQQQQQHQQNSQLSSSGGTPKITTTSTISTPKTPILKTTTTTPDATTATTLTTTTVFIQTTPTTTTTPTTQTTATATATTTTTTTTSAAAATITTTPATNQKNHHHNYHHHHHHHHHNYHNISLQQNNFKGWYIQPACAITGEGLQEGLDALYDMIIKKRKMNKANKKKR